MAKSPLRLILTAATALALSATTGLAQDDTPIRFGGMSSVSGGGAGIGAMAMVGYRLAVDELNQKGGVLGRRVELVEADTQTNPTHAVSELRRLVDCQEVKALMGPATSQEAIPVSDLAKDMNILQITTAASTDLTPDRGPLHFSLSPLGVDQMIPNVDYALNVLGVTKLAIISDNGGMSKSGVADLLAYLDQKGVQPVAVQEFAFKTEDLTPQLFSMRRAGAEAVLLINSLYDDSARLLQNRAEIGWEVPVLGNLTTVSNARTIAANIGADAMQGVYGTMFVGTTYCPGDAEGSSAYAQYVAHARAAYPDIDRVGGPASVAQFYLAPIIAAAAAEGAGSTDGQAMADWITGQDKIDTILGPLGGDPDSHFLPGLPAMAMVKEPHLVRDDGTYLRADCPEAG